MNYLNLKRATDWNDFQCADLVTCFLAMTKTISDVDVVAEAWRSVQARVAERVHAAGRCVEAATKKGWGSNGLL